MVENKITMKLSDFMNFILCSYGQLFSLFYFILYSRFGKSLIVIQPISVENKISLHAQHCAHIICPFIFEYMSYLTNNIPFICLSFSIFKKFIIRKLIIYIEINGFNKKNSIYKIKLYFSFMKEDEIYIFKSDLVWRMQLNII